MESGTKELFDLMARIITSAGVLVTATSLLLTWKVRVADLKWRKICASRDALFDIHKNAYAIEALNMADAIFFKEVYTAPAGLVDMRSVDSAEVDAFLHCGTSTALTREQVAYVRRCFDWLLYYFDRVAYLHENGMLESTDFDATVKPYASFIAERWAYLERIASQASYVNVHRQIVRFLEAASSQDPFSHRSIENVGQPLGE